MLKTGLIQPETIPGQFPRNLRTIVELYRSCLDQGAEIVLCPSLALGGVHVGELALRSGFRAQYRAALNYLAREMAEAPLLLGAPDEKGIRLHLLKNGHSFPQQAIIPEENREKPPSALFGIFRTQKAAGFSVGPWPPSPLPRSSTPCLLFRTPFSSWHEGLLEQEEEEGRSMAAEAGIPLASCRMAGAEGPFLLPGASSLWSGEGSLLGRLRLFERDFDVIYPEHPSMQEPSLPAPEEQLRHALRKGTADFIQKSGHASVCLNLLESPSSFFLVHLLKQIGKELPSLSVTGLIPCADGFSKQEATRAAGMAEKQGIRPLLLPPSTEDGGLDVHLTSAWLMRQWADEEGVLMLSALNGTDVMTDFRAARAAIAADFMPLADLYETELAALFPGLSVSVPEAAGRDSLLAALHRKHVSATHLAALHPEREQQIRSMQRQARASEWLRRKLPPRLMLRSIPGTPEPPAIHRLMD